MIQNRQKRREQTNKRNREHLAAVKQAFSPTTNEATNAKPKTTHDASNRTTIEL